ERIDPVRREVQALILCPTRELAMQVTEQVNILGKYLGVTALPIYGGASYTDQHRGLHQGLPVVVGTPGRICDHIRRGTLNLESLQVMILDEADEMISMGFKDDLTAILDCLPEGQANTWLFSATMSNDVRRVADTYLKNPQQVQVNRTEMVPTAIEQRYYVTHEANKPEVLRKLIDAVDDFYGLVFCQTKALVSDLTMYLLDRGYRVDSLHGDKSQAAREITMKAFRDRKVKLLICTDVAARGLDVKDVTHVINYSIPKELDSYVHRIGRTARCGKSGFALSLISPRQRVLIAQIERLTKSKLQEGTIPTRKELGVKKVSFYLQKFQEPAGYARAVEALGDGWKELLATMTPEEVAGRFLALTFPDIFAERDPERSAPMPSSGFPSSGERSERSSGPRPARGDSRIRPVVAAVSRPEGSRAWDKVSARATRQDDAGDDKVGKGGNKPFKKYPAAAAAAGGSKFAGKAKKPGKKTAWANP
ncbi:MAG: DEAD/DEAH box helicase, partial [Pseudobdellovibrionaceae bacterium]|nr:DEAD/DEAH box helicase [Pseudobdellovibrionaceae bacterium]